MAAVSHGNAGTPHPTACTYPNKCSKLQLYLGCAKWRLNGRDCTAILVFHQNAEPLTVRWVS